MGFELHSGFVYKLNNFDVSVIVRLMDYGVQLTEVGSIGAIVNGSFYNDRANKILYLRFNDSNPNGRFIVCHYRLFFSNVPISLPYDLGVGREVEWVPYILSTSQFGVEIDNENQQGFAIEGSGSINLVNNQDYWRHTFDKVTWENKPVKIYSYNRDLPVDEIQIIYQGTITKKSWKQDVIQFGLKDIISELKKEIVLENIEDFPTSLVPNNLLLAKQRLVYGYVNGHVPTPIDQVVQGFSGSGVIDVTNGSIVVNGTGTQFLYELSPDDQLLIQGDDEKYTVARIISDTQLELTEAWNEATRVNRSFDITPSLPKRYKNRKFLVAGHATKEPVTTITARISLNYFQVADDSDLLVGDRIEIGSESVRIRRVNSNYIKTTTTLNSLPPVGTVVKRPSVSDVYINNQRIFEENYTYYPSTGVLEIDDLAEFNIAQVKSLLGDSITLTLGSRTVTGVNTFFESQLKPSDWIRIEGQAEYFEILQIISDTELELRTVSTYTGTDIGFFKSPDYYRESQSVLSVNCIGKTKDGLSTGQFIKTSSEIVEDILTDAGLGYALYSPSFLTARSLAPQRVGLVIPSKVNDNKTKSVRDVIGDISESVFGSLIQTNDFKLAYKILSPRRNLSDLKLKELDVISFSITADSSKIIQKAVVNYDFKEYDFEALASSNKKTEHEPDENKYLTESKLVQTYDSRLVDLSDADIMAERYALILQLARSKISLDTKLQAMSLGATDKIWFSSEKLYERVGTGLRQKVSAIESIKKDGLKVGLETDDLSNAFSRCGTVTENTANSYDDSSENELLINGYITDNFGMQDNDADTFGVNLIW
jgi:hypothetical protein